MRRCQQHRGQVRHFTTVAAAVQRLQKPPTMLYCAAGAEYLFAPILFSRFCVHDIEVVVYVGLCVWRTRGRVGTFLLPAVPNVCE